MKKSVVIHMEHSDTAEVREYDKSIWVEMRSVHEREGVPIYAKTPEQFDALADAVEDAARRMRLRQARAVPLTLEQELEREA